MVVVVVSMIVVAVPEGTGEKGEMGEDETTAGEGGTKGGIGNLGMLVGASDFARLGGSGMTSSSSSLSKSITSTALLGFCAGAEAGTGTGTGTATTGDEMVIGRTTGEACVYD